MTGSPQRRLREKVLPAAAGLAPAATTSARTEERPRMKAFESSLAARTTQRGMTTPLGGTTQRGMTTPCPFLATILCQ